MRYAVTIITALMLAGCGGQNDPWIELNTAKANQQCAAQHLTPDTPAFQQCFDATLTKLQDYR